MDAYQRCRTPKQLNQKQRAHSFSHQSTINLSITIYFIFNNQDTQQLYIYLQGMNQVDTVENLQQLLDCFWKISRNEQLRYYIKLSSIINEVSTIANDQLRKCKYCKAYPFNVTQLHPSNTAKQCELCGSINQYEMRQTLSKEEQAAKGYENYSYIIPYKQAILLEVRGILIIDLNLSVANIEMMMHSLSSVLINQYFEVAILFIFQGNLSIINFDEECCLIYLTEDLCLKSEIEQYSTRITPQKMKSLQNIIKILKQTQTKQITNFSLISSVLSSYKSQDNNFVNIFIWIGKLPSQGFDLPNNCMHTIALLVNDKKIKNANQLVQLKLYFNEFHLIEGDDQQTQLYYKIYEILDRNRYANIITSQLIIKTNYKYSGTINNYPPRIINNYAPLMQIEVSKLQKHKIQIYFEYYSCESATRYFIVINLEDKELKKNALFERSIMISRALKYVMQQYKILKCSTEKKNKDFDYFFISNCLSEYGNKFQNNTKWYQQLLKWMSEYFKQFQKDIYKLYTPFSLLGKTSISYIFFPIYTQSGLLHYYSGYHVQSEIDHQLETVNQLCQIFYCPQQLKLPIFYRLCKDNENVIRLGVNHS